MLSKKLLTVLSLILIAGFVLPACQPEPEVIEVTVPPEEIEVTVPPEQIEVTVPPEQIEVTVPPPVAPGLAERQGAIPDTLIVVEEPSDDQAVVRLEVGELDIYAFTVSNPEVVAAVQESAVLDSIRSFGSYNELSFNPVGPTFPGTGALNPFSVPRIREAMNYLIDREFIVQEIMGGLAAPRWLPFNLASNDYALLAAEARAIELQYAYNPELAEEIITEEMEALGATLEGGLWQFEGEDVEISVLIRSEDERVEIGDYVASQLEDIGFTVVRDYRTAAEASPIWLSGNPADGLFHIYTGGWITTVVPRNLADNFAFFYTDMGLATPLWQAYENDPEFYDLADRLDRSDFTTAEERVELMARALELSMEDSHRVWLTDRASETPKRQEAAVSADLYGAVAGSWLWPYTIQRTGEIGGSMTVGMPSILSEAWNPYDGSNWIYDMMLIRGLGENAIIPDPFTGLYRPQRLERGEVLVTEGTPIFQTLDWVDLEFTDEIVVPDDAWVDWDAEEQRFLTAGEVYTVPETVVRQSIAYYEPDTFDKVFWHDGSPFTIGDILWNMVTTFDRAKEASPYYDESKVPGFNSFMAAFRGVRIVSEDPLVIETYSNSFQPDAENTVTHWWPFYAQGQGSWHQLALGHMAEEKELAGYSASKADLLEAERLNYIAGPTIEVLNDQLEEIQETGVIPYAEFLGQWVDDDEIQTRMDNLAEWHRRRGHFWVGTGPWWLERAFPVEGTVVMRRFVDYPDMADKWAIFAEAPIAEVDLDGPANVTIGQEAVYDVFVDFAGEPYPLADIVEVKYLVIDATGNVAHVGEAVGVEDGLFELVLDADVTGNLEAGSNRLEVVVVSELVAVPSTDALTFVTAP